MHCHCLSLQSYSSMLFLFKYGFSSFLLETQWAGYVHPLTSSQHKTVRFPVRTFPFILLWQERKEERTPLKHMATSKQHHYVFDKKNPHSNIFIVISVAEKMHPHFNNTTDNAKMSLKVHCHRGGILLPSLFTEEGFRPDKERSQVSFAL